MRVAITAKVLYDETVAAFGEFFAIWWEYLSIPLYPLEGFINLYRKSPDVVDIERWIFWFSVAGTLGATLAGVAAHYSYIWWAISGGVVYAITLTGYQLFMHPDIFEELEDGWSKH